MTRCSQTYRGEKVRPTYTRGLNPTVRMFEEMLAKLEGAEDAIGFASGMSAISSAVLSFVEPGDRIVAVRHVYPDAFRLFGTLLKRMRVEVTYVDGRDEEAVAQAPCPAPSCSTWKARPAGSWRRMTSARLPRWPRRAASRPSSTTAGRRPVFQRPLSLGVDLVVHSASKYLGGHSDVVAGVVAGSNELIGRIRAEAYPYLGGKLSPFDAWLLIRGLRTLPIRMRAHQASALDDRRAPAGSPDRRDGLPSRPRQPAARRAHRHVGPVLVRLPRRHRHPAVRRPPASCSSSASAGAAMRA